MVVGAKNEGQVFQAYDQYQRPEHQRENSHHVGMTHIDTVLTVETLSNGIYRAGADIPENHPQGGK
jgi:hypothetical protein